MRSIALFVIAITTLILFAVPAIVNLDTMSRIYVGVICAFAYFGAGIVLWSYDIKED